MQVNPYLHFNGNCEAAFKFYAKVLGAKIDAMLTHEGMPPEMPIPPEWKQKIMHARDGDRRRSDHGVGRASGPFPSAAGLFGRIAGRGSRSRAEQKFKALSEGGTVNMPFGKTFFSKGFGMCVDQFGIPWMVNCPMEGDVLSGMSG